MKTLYLAWQDQENRRWLPVGKLVDDDKGYKFVYTQGAKASKNFTPFGRMTDLNVVYHSKELFPLFSNRLLSRNRPEFKTFLHWLDLTEHNADPLVILSVTGGIRGTDNLEVFPCPSPSEENRYESKFFNHGLRYTCESAIERVNKLVPGEQLYLMHDLQNPHDSLALALRTGNPATIVGYCPRYFNRDFHDLIKACGSSEVVVTVEKVNAEAPLQFRLLCKISAPWPKDFKPCADINFQPLVDDMVACNFR